MPVSIVFEAYFLMFFVALHMSVFACDNSCLFGIQELGKLFPSIVRTWAVHLITLTGISMVYAKVIAHVVLLGDFCICFIVAIRTIDFLFKPFVAVFTSLALSVWLLQRIQVI